MPCILLWFHNTNIYGQYKLQHKLLQSIKITRSKESDLFCLDHYIVQNIHIYVALYTFY